MQLLEHQAKELLKKAGAPLADSVVVYSPVELEAIALPFPLVVKSQVPVGGRGKLGGITLVKNKPELEKAYHAIMALDIKGHTPDCVLVETALDIKQELYLALRVDRDKRRVEYIVSREGGIEIESHSSSTMSIPVETADRSVLIGKLLDLPEIACIPLLEALERCLYDNDLLLLEINPLAVTSSGELVCADAKATVDDNARFRHPDFSWPDESSIKPLGGSIGVIANGAGMAMSTMDTIYAAGARPANFLDIGGGTGEDVFVKNLREITTLPGVTSIIINIFAGITRCDDIARGIIAAKKQIPDLVPLFIRLEGTNRDEAAQLLQDADIELQPDLKTCIELVLLAEPGDKRVVSTDAPTSFSEDSVFPAERGKTNQQLAPSESEEKEGGSVNQTMFDNHSVIIQGITGHHGSFHAKGMIDAGTNIVAGVTPGKAGEIVHDIPVYNTVADAVTAHSATASVIFVPARFAKDAMREAIEAGIRLIVCITEGIPIHDMLAVREHAKEKGVVIVGPNCPGLIVPASHKLGIIAAHITSPGATTVISRSGTLTYELADALTKKGIGQRIILGIGGDPVQGMNFVEALEIAEHDPGTEQIIMVGEIGGESEQMAADFIAEYVTKPVYGLVVGHSLPAGQTFGHAGAIVGSRGESADDKTTYMATKGIHMSATLDALIQIIM